MQTRQHIEELIRVSQMYYDEGLNQSQIAGEVGYSRSSVSRMLTEARETGIVQITIGHPLQRLQSLEENLRDKYGLKTVRVAYSYDDNIASMLVPQCAAQLLMENLKPDSLIVTSTGTPMAATIRALPPLDYPRAHVTQMLGSLSSANSLTDSPEICRMMAERLGCAYSLLPAPLIMGSAEVAQAVRSEKLIAMTLALGNRADIAIVGVGAIRQGHSGKIFHSFEDAAVARELCRKREWSGIFADIISIWMAIMCEPVCVSAPSASISNGFVTFHWSLESLGRRGVRGHCTHAWSVD